jgi:predicted amidohydrolase
MKVASIQLSVVENNKTATIDKAVEGIREAKGADLIVLPELWNIAFMSFERYVPEAEDRNGSTLSALRNAARECKVHLHTGSFVEKEGGKLFNSSYLLSPEGEILANYKEIHLFGYNSKETQILTHGKQVVVAETACSRALPPSGGKGGGAFPCLFGLALSEAGVRDHAEPGPCP